MQSIVALFGTESETCPQDRKFYRQKKPQEIRHITEDTLYSEDKAWTEGPTEKQNQLKSMTRAVRSVQ